MSRSAATFDFSQVDVFTDVPLAGNPLAVVHGADALDDARMAAMARWTNLSETAFLLAPTDPSADYRVRIFTPRHELPFAGHPTLGSCHAWLKRGGGPKRAGEIVQQCGVGLVRIRRDGDSGRLAFAAPPLARAEVDAASLDAALAAIGVSRAQLVDAQWLRNGPNWLGLLLDSAATVLAIEPDAAAFASIEALGVIGARDMGDIGEGHGRHHSVEDGCGPQPPAEDTAFEVRAFVGGGSMYEDPVTGSLNAGFAQWLIETGRAPARFVAAQGTRLGRAGRVHVAREGPTLWVGGASVTCIHGRAIV